MDKAFAQAAAILPREMRVAALALPEEAQAVCEELHLRAGRTLTWSDGCREQVVPVGGQAAQVTGDDLRMMLEAATRASYHNALERFRDGFYPLPGGHRLGLCGCGVMEGGRLYTLREPSSLTIRIARETRGIARPLLEELTEDGTFCSTLILAPPGRGKTTLLRDLIRTLSDGEAGPGLRVSLADERGEVAAVLNGAPQLDVGVRTDVLSGCPKAAGMLLLLRSMNPQILACDEVTAPEDVAAMTVGAHCGVGLLATAHGGGTEDLERRPLYRRLLREGIFRRAVLIRQEGRARRYQVEKLPCSG